MNFTLYDRLNRAELINEALHRDFESLGRSFLTSGRELGIPMPRLPVLPKYDVAKIQRSLFQQYEHNPLLQRAVKGKKSLEEITLDLGANKTIFFLTPHHKNDDINKIVTYLGELVPNAEDLRRRGIFDFRNGLNAAGYFAVPIAGLVLAGAAAADYEVSKAISTAGICGGVIASFPGIAVFSVTALGGAANVKQAQYIDEKIKELF